MPYKDPEKQREYQRLRYARIRKDWFDKNGPCAKCGSYERLELDHIIEKDKFTHKIWSYSEKRRDEELAKCQILCYECHLEKTINYLSKEFKHGEELSYDKGCRCQLCRDAHAAYKRNYRQRKKDRELNNNL